MFMYFQENYWWSLMVMGSLGMGGEISEIDEICRPLRDVAGRNDDVAREAWFEGWSRMASRLERVARDRRDAGFRVSASRLFLRAANYQLLAEGMVQFGHNRKLQAYERALELFRQGIRLQDHPVEFVDVPFEGTTLPAIFVPATGASSRAPCLVHFDGSDDVKEITYLRHGLGLANRGIATLIVDHPGSGGSLRLRNLRARPDIETAASAAVDFLEQRPDVDPDRVGIIAQSLGGYYAPRAAAFEPRFKLCVVWGAIWDWYRVREGQGSTFEPKDFQLFRSSDRDEVIGLVRQFTLEGGIAERVRCPVLIVHGENDRQCPLWTAETTYDRMTGSPRRELKVFRLDEGGASHCGADVKSMVTDYIHDWVARFFDL
jgi:dienelactone hydrolase